MSKNMHVDPDTESAGRDVMLTAAEAADYAGVSVQTIKRAVKAGKIAEMRTPGGHLRFHRSDVDAMLRGHAATA
jgi:excisionase family DNA binding protein